MSLTAGDHLGPYTILGPLGSGGMGEVYRAHDPRLGRDVALKLLPLAFAQDADRLARFQREAQVLASLNHPNIGGIHGVEDAAGVRALVLELVEGPTLADRIAQGPIPLDETLAIARQIADALEAAHEHGVIHRDLKPANIKLRADGAVKVLDFGLAKPSEAAVSASGLSMSPTITSPAMTMAGVILGTAAYMSPEQAKGKPVDERADVWAFGCVLYEMLTGQRPFAGEDVSDALALVLTKEPDWGMLPAALSPSLRVILQRCLAKDPKQRIRSIGDVRLALDGAYGVLVYGGPPAPGAMAPRSLMWVDRTGRATTAFGELAPYRYPALSADGKHVSVGIETDIWVLDVDRQSRTRLTREDRVPPVGSRAGVGAPVPLTVWSHDAKRVTFSSMKSPSSYALEWINADGSGQRVERIWSG